MRLPDLTPAQLLDFLLAVAPRRPVMIRGQPGIGKSALVERFSADIGMPCKGRTNISPLGGAKSGQWGGVAAAA